MDTNRNSGRSDNVPQDGALDITQVAEDKAEITRTNSPQSLAVDSLQRQLANAFLSYLNYQASAWQIGVNTEFRQMADEARHCFEQLGDRLRMIGQDPNLQVETLSERASVEQIATVSATVSGMVKASDDNAIVMIREIRDAVKALQQEGADPGTADLLIRVLCVHERHEWILRQLLKPDRD